jgi:hypothetical protein
MNLEIKEKYNNFVKIIENKEKLEWLKQTNNYLPSDQELQKQELKPVNNLDNLANCSCNISSGYTSSSNKIDKKNNSIESKSKSKSKSNKSSINDKIYKQASNNKYSNDDELSLLEDDYFISKRNLTNSNDLNKLDNLDKSENLKSIKTEFQNIFIINEYTNNNKIIKKNESSEIKNKLENIYNKIVVKKLHQNNNEINKLSGYDIANYISPKEQINKTTIDLSIKKLSDLIEYIYSESIRGWDKEHNLYIIQFDKLKENFKKIVFNQDITNEIKFGFIYRDFNEPKSYLTKDFTKYWVGYDIESSKSDKLQQINYSIKNKILYYCLKNLTKSNKFKKKISKWNYKFIKKTFQVYSHKNLLIDIILFVGIKNNE